MTHFPRADVAPPDGPSRLAWLDHDSGLPVVEARLAGDRDATSLPVLLDTGAGTCVLTDAVAERLGVRFVSDEPLPVQGIAGQANTARAAVLAELQLGAWTVRNVPVAVVAAEHLRTTGGSLSGLVGWEILRHVALELSASRREIVVDRSRAQRDDAGERNLVLLSEPLVRLRCDGAPVLLLLDTGSTFTLVNGDLVRRLGLATRAGGRETVTGVGGDSQVDVAHVTRLPLLCGRTQLTLGDVPAIDQQPAPLGLPRVDGAIGMDVLAAVRVVVDGPARTLTLQAE